MISEVSVFEKFAKITEHWSPKIIGELNGQHVKLVKVQGELVWHNHEQEDEMFLVFKGTLLMDFEDKTTKTGPGEILIIPKGVLHRPHTNDEEVWIMLIEPASIKHLGDVEHEKAVKNFEWI